jgi:hypothetical protein
MFSQADGDTLLSLLGEDVSNKIRRSDLKKLRGSSVPVKKETSVSSSNAKPAKGFKHPDDYFEDLRKKLT